MAEVAIVAAAGRIDVAIKVEVVSVGSARGGSRGPVAAPLASVPEWRARVAWSDIPAPHKE